MGILIDLAPKNYHIAPHLDGVLVVNLLQPNIITEHMKKTKLF